VNANYYFVFEIHVGHWYFYLDAAHFNIFPKRALTQNMSHARCCAAFFPKYPRTVRRVAVGDLLRGQVDAIVIPTHFWPQWADAFPGLPPVNLDLPRCTVTQPPSGVKFVMIVCASEQRVPDARSSAQCSVHHRFSKRRYLAFHHKRLVWKSTLESDGTCTVAYVAFDHEPNRFYQGLPQVNLYDPARQSQYPVTEYDPDSPSMGPELAPKQVCFLNPVVTFAKN